jgi:hypothetical protein
LETWPRDYSTSATNVALRRGRSGFEASPWWRWSELVDSTSNQAAVPVIVPSEELSSPHPYTSACLAKRIGDEKATKSEPALRFHLTSLISVQEVALRSESCHARARESQLLSYSPSPNYQIWLLGGRCGRWSAGGGALTRRARMKRVRCSWTTRRVKGRR